MDQMTYVRMMIAKPTEYPEMPKPVEIAERSNVVVIPTNASESVEKHINLHNPKAMAEKAKAFYENFKIPEAESLNKEASKKMAAKIYKGIK